MEEKCYCVYRHTSPTGKVYIGITRQRLQKRWQNGRGYLNSHNKRFYNAILRYGWENFRHEILNTGLSKEEAENLEIQLIAEHRATDPAHGYNQDKGGNHNGRCTEATRRKLSEAKRGSRNPMYGSHTCHHEPPRLSGAAHPMYGRRGANNPRTGMRHNQEAIEKMRKNNKKNKPVICVETGAKYPSAQAAGRAIGITGGGVAGCCNRKRHYNTAGGYHWRWEDAT